jgi:hypothetical protein
MDDFADAKRLLEAHGIGFEVGSAELLCEKITELDHRPELYSEICRRSLALAGRQRNVADRQADIITRNN